MKWKKWMIMTLIILAYFIYLAVDNFYCKTLDQRFSLFIYSIIGVVFGFTMSKINEN